MSSGSGPTTSPTTAGAGFKVSLKKQPHTQQQLFIDRDEPEQLYGGAKRGGKSVALCQKLILLNVMFPGNRGLLARYNFTDLQDTTLSEFFEVCPSELILSHHKGDRTIVLRSVDDRSTHPSRSTKDGYSPFASRQLYRGLGDPEEFEKVKGISLGHLEIDEPSEVPFEQYLMLRAQLTWQLPDGDRPPYMCLLASNPEPGWVEERFITTPGPGCIFIPSLPRDNPYLPPDYEAGLRANYPADWVIKYLDGVWGASEGAVFKELDERLHDLDNWLEPNKWLDFCWPLNLFLAIDHADTGVTAMVLLGIDALGRMYALQEYYQSNRVVSEHCFGMREIVDPYLSKSVGSGGIMQKQVGYRLIDPSTVSKTQQRGQSLQGIIEDYRANGFPCIPAWNALEHGLNLIAEHLHPIPVTKHPFTNIYGSPSLFISRSRCPNLWKQLRGLKRKVRSNGYVEFIGVDHALDCLRYLVNSRPRRPELARIDEMGMGGADLFAKRSHDRWVKQFIGTGTGVWHSGLGFS